MITVLTPHDPLTPDFLVSTEYYQVENEGKLDRFGDSKEYFYKTKKEKNEIFDRKIFLWNM